MITFTKLIVLWLLILKVTKINCLWWENQAVTYALCSGFVFNWAKSDVSVRPCEVWTKSINRSARSPLPREKAISAAAPLVDVAGRAAPPLVDVACRPAGWALVHPSPCSRAPCTPRYQGRSCCSVTMGCAAVVLLEVSCTCTTRSPPATSPSPGALQSPPSISL